MTYTEAELRDELKLSHDANRLTERCYEIFKLMIDHIAEYYFTMPAGIFSNIPFEEQKEIKEAAVLTIASFWEKFNIESEDSPISYFHTCGKSALIGICYKFNQQK